MCNDYRYSNFCPEKKDIRNEKSTLINKINTVSRFTNHRNALDNIQFYRDYLSLYNQKCSYCGVTVSVVSIDLMQIDHFIPTASREEQLDNLSNLVLSCKNCNMSKYDLIIKNDYRDLLHPDKKLHNVFFRDKLYYIKPNEIYQNDLEINHFYKKLKLHHDVRRLDFLLVELTQMLKHINGNSPVVTKIYELKEYLLDKRNSFITV